jgi:UDP-glucose:(heptosyl)LPS alpha-1,3-glucosyltransferase
MKIAINIEKLGQRRGGAEKYAATVTRWLINAGHEVHVFATDADADELPAGTPIHHVRPFCPFGFGWLRTFLFARASEAALRQQHFDLIIGFNKVWYVHAYLAVGGAQPATLACNSQRFRSPLVRGAWWLTKWLSLKQWVFRWIAHKQFAGTYRPHVIAPAHFVADHFTQYHGVPRAEISVVYNALDSLATPPDESTARTNFRQRHGLGPNDVAVLFVARNYELKGLEPLLEAFAKVASQSTTARLIVCGSRRDRRFRRQAAKLGLQDRVLFLGFVDEIRECFAGCDVFAFPTFYDPCSLVVLEAMNAGLPVITTKQNGAGELLTEGGDGFVIDSPWSIDQLADRITRLANDADLRQHMSHTARQNVLRYTIEAREQELLTALTKAATSKI